MKNKLNLSEIVRNIAHDEGLPINQVKRILDLTVYRIESELARGGAVNLSGIGILEVVSVKAKIGRNPKTGEVHPIPAGKKVRFKTSTSLKKIY